MELTVFKRASQAKSETKKIRREGNIPAVLYSEGKKGEEFYVEGAAFKKILNQIQPGFLPTKIFSLEKEEKKIKAIIKDIQYNPVSYDVIHLDFFELHEDTVVNINVPINCIGMLDCPGAKLGGSPRLLSRFVKVRCLPKDIPVCFDLDVREVGLNESKHLRDISIAQSIRPLADLKDLIFTITK